MVIKISNIFATPRSRKEIIAYCGIIRKISKYKSSFFDIVRFLEEDAYDFLGITIEIVEENELNYNEYAKFIPSKKVIKIRQSVYEGAINGNGKDRFTLAHELGHAFLHREICLYRSEEQPKPYENPEWQADEFAANLLCPLAEIYNKNIIEITDEYGVSKSVAEIQRKKLATNGF